MVDLDEWCFSCFRGFRCPSGFFLSRVVWRDLRFFVAFCVVFSMNMVWSLFALCHIKERGSAIMRF